MSSKKEQLAETVQQQRDEASQLEKELEEKRKQLRELGGEVLKGDEVQLFCTVSVVVCS